MSESNSLSKSELLKELESLPSRNTFYKTAYLNYVFLLSALQFLPLQEDFKLQSTPLANAFQSENVLIIAGFCLGFLVLILVDLLVDAFMRRWDMWFSRSCYFFIPCLWSLLIINYHHGDNFPTIFLTYQSAFVVFFSGRAFLDLALNDLRQSWSFTRSCLLLTLLSAGQILSNYGLCYGNTVMMAGTVLNAVYLGLFILNSCKCVYLLISNKNAKSMYKKVQLFNYDETLIFSIVSTMVIGAILITILPVFTQSDFGDVTTSNPWHICGTLIIATFMSCSLGLLPSLLLKHKAIHLQADLDLKSLFVRNVSHEIRTPLNIAVVGMDILMRTRSRITNTLRSKEEDEMIEEIMDSCKVAITILDDLLSYEKVSTGDLKLEIAPVPVASFVRSCASLFNIQARAKNIDLRVLDNPDCIPESVQFSVDFGKLTQVLRNFISNALKFTPECGVVRVIAFERRNEMVPGFGTVVIQVIDTGVGMTPVQLSRIFNEVIQFDSNALQAGGGSGIGLWVSKKIVDLHGGTVKVTSKGRKKGCTFELEIPVSLYSILTATSAKAKKRRTSFDLDRKSTSGNVVRRMIMNSPVGYNHQVAHSNSPNEPNFLSEIQLCQFDRLHILVVDDSKLNRKFMSRLLSTCSNISVDEAEDGAECLEKVNAAPHKYDAILMDNNMPNIDGMTAASELRKRVLFQEAIIGITGNSHPDDIRDFIDAGADDVLVKPVTFLQLEECLGKTLRVHGKRMATLGELSSDLYSAHTLHERIKTQPPLIRSQNSSVVVAVASKD